MLQRIAICYLIAGLLYLWDRRWQRAKSSCSSSHCGATGSRCAGFPYSGLGVPGRDIPFLDKDANLVAWLDRHLLPGRLYEGTRDPEGLLSDLPALGTALLGVLTGIWLRSKHTLHGKAAGLAAGAATCLAIGSLWAFSFPLNKKLWTSSHVLVAAGIATALLALFFWMIEVHN